MQWFEYYQTIPRIHKYSFGQRIDNLFVEAIEAISTASFLSKQEKLPCVRQAIRKIDTIKIFLLILWEVKSLNDKKYIALSLKLDEIGKMLGGWMGQLQKSLEQVRDKQNSPTKVGEKWRDWREEEHEAVLTIPPVVGVVPERLEPPTLVVAVETEKVQVAVRVRLRIKCHPLHHP